MMISDYRNINEGDKIVLTGIGWDKLENELRIQTVDSIVSYNEGKNASVTLKNDDFVYEVDQKLYVMMRVDDVRSINAV